MTKQAVSIDPRLVSEARHEILEAIDERKLHAHAHFRRYSSQNNRDGMVWYLVSYSTRLCGTDRCIKMWVVEE